VRYLQDLWDQIADSPGDIPIPDSHLELAEARLRRYRDDPGKAKSAFEALDRWARERSEPLSNRRGKWIIGFLFDLQ
jgi:putative addiction module component (TIGR02574 family)